MTSVRTLSPYHISEYAGFIDAMRKGDSADRAAPLALADWLEERGKGDHARFIRGCVRMGELRDILDECSKMDLHYTDPEKAVPSNELSDLVYDLRPLINRHCHEWTGGWVRKFENPTVYDWRNGFLWNVRIDTAALLRRAPALCRRQPVQKISLPRLMVMDARCKLALIDVQVMGVTVTPIL